MATIQTGPRKPISHSDRIALENWLNAWLASDGQPNVENTANSGRAILPPQIQVGENVFDFLIFDHFNQSHRDLKPTTDLCQKRRLGHLSIGLPENSFLNPYEPPNLYWFPSGIPAGRSICVASSRLGKNLDHHDYWFDALRTLATRIDPDSEFLITADHTTTNRYLQRVGELFRIPVVNLRPMPIRPNRKWLQECLRQTSHQRDSSPQNSICYFQSLETNVLPARSKNQPLSIDGILVAIATEVNLLSVRKDGNIHASAKRRLHQCPATTTKLLVKSSRQRPERDDLISAGAIAWWLYPDPAQPPSDSDPGTFHATVPRLKLSEFPADRFLLHWTRRRVGPWPDQTEHEFLDDLIFQTDRRQHHETAVLSRILATHRILASNDLTRDGQPVVCFSNHPLTEMGHRRIFRQHLGRWDFQPFGIAIDRQLLTKLGAKPVIYGDEGTWESLNASDRPFFQTAKSANGKIDWTTEKEWRLAGDLDLNQLDIGAVVVFSENETAADALAPLSRWPIVVLDS